MSGLLQGLSKMTQLGIFEQIAEDLFDFIVSVTIGPLLWGLCDIFFVLLDMFEYLFKALAGTLEGGITIQGQRGVEGDIVLFLMESAIVSQIFMSIMILSWILLIIFTVLAIVKNQYSDKQEPVSKIINSSFKGLFMYLLVPVATVVCLIVGNAILQAIDGATKAQSNATSASGMLFVSASRNANKLRDSSVSDAKLRLERMYLNPLMLNRNTKARIQAEVGISGYSDIEAVIGDSSAKMESVATIIDEQMAADDLTLMGERWNFTVVQAFYHPLSISYITIWVGGAFLIYAIGKICWGLLARIFKMTVYYAISPIVMATYPIDNGGALTKWRGEMVKLGTSAYAAVGVTNILYSILPVFTGIEIGGWLGSQIIKLFMMIILFSSVSSLISTISGWFGVGDAFADGIAAKKQVSEGLKKPVAATKKVSSTFNGLVGGAKEGKLGGALLGAWKGSGLADSTGFDPVKLRQEGDKQRKDAGQYIKDFRTTGIRANYWKQKYAEDDTQKAFQKQWENKWGNKAYNSGVQPDGTVALDDNKRKDSTFKQMTEYSYNSSESGKIMFADEIAKQERDEEEQKQKEGYAATIETFGKQVDAKNKAEAEFNKLVQAIFGRENVSEDEIDSKLMEDSVQARRLEELKKAKEYAQSEYKYQEKKFKREFENNSAFKQFAEAHNFVTTDNDGHTTYDTSVIDEMADEVAEATKNIKRAGEDLKIKEADVNYREGTGALTDAEKKKLKAYNEANPKSS